MHSISRFNLVVGAAVIMALAGCGGGGDSPSPTGGSKSSSSSTSTGPSVSYNTPVQLVLPRRIAIIEDNQGIVLRSDGTPIVWGIDIRGISDIGTRISGKVSAKTIPLKLQSLRTGSEVGLGLTGNGEPIGWGRRQEGSVMGGYDDDNSTAAMTLDFPGQKIKQTAQVGYGVIALAENGTVWLNPGEVIKNINKTYRDYAFGKKISTLSDVAMISETNWHTGLYYVVKNDGSVHRLENYKPESTISPFTSLYNPKQITCNIYYCLAIKSDSTVVGWGSNIDMTLGSNNQTLQVASPKEIPRLSNIKQVFASDPAVAITLSGDVYSWGSGNLGQGEKYSESLNPIKVTGLSNITEGACWYTTCIFLKSDGTIWSWNTDSGVFDNPPPKQYVPQQITEVTVN